MTDTTPDIAGFLDAQRRLISATGSDVAFIMVAPKTYAADVALDPETGEPYDPTVVPTSGGDETRLTITAGVVLNAVQPNDPVLATPSGERRTEDCALLVPSDLHLLVDDAVAFELNGIRYKLTEWLPDSLASQQDRWIAYGEAE
jgi:hypothetical protein